jgi:hypothetical protein
MQPVRSNNPHPAMKFLHKNASPAPGTTPREAEELASLMRKHIVGLALTP